MDSLRRTDLTAYADGFPADELLGFALTSTVVEPNTIARFGESSSSKGVCKGSQGERYQNISCSTCRSPDSCLQA